MKKIILILFIPFFTTSCSTEDETIEVSNSLFSGKYYYLDLNSYKCQNDYLEFSNNSWMEVSFFNSNIGNCKSTQQGMDQGTFSIINDSIAKTGNDDYLKITQQGGNYRFINTVDGMTLNDLIASDGNNADTWYMKR